MILDSNFNVAIAPSLSKGNTFYIFRSNGIEIEIELINGKPIANQDLTENETYFLNLFYKKLINAKNNF